MKSLLKCAEDPNDVLSFIDKIGDDWKEGINLIKGKKTGYVGNWIMCVFSGETSEEKPQKLLQKAKQAH